MSGDEQKYVTHSCTVRMIYDSILLYCTYVQYVTYDTVWKWKWKKENTVSSQYVKYFLYLNFKYYYGNGNGIDMYSTMMI